MKLGIWVPPSGPGVAGWKEPCAPPGGLDRFKKLCHGSGPEFATLGPVESIPGGTLELSLDPGCCTKRPGRDSVELACAGVCEKETGNENTGGSEGPDGNPVGLLSSPVRAVAPPLAG